MSSSNYQGPDINNTSQDSSQDKKQRHPDYIALQRITHDLSTFQLLKLYVNVMIVLTTTKFVINIIDINSDDQNESRLTQIIDTIIKFLQIFGYAYGLQAYVSKSVVQANVFQVFLIFAFAFIGYYAYNNYVQKEWLSFGLEVFHFNFNILLLILVRRFINLLYKRDSLKKSLEKLGQP